MPEGEVSSSGILFVPFDKLKKYNILSLQITWDLEKKGALKACHQLFLNVN